GKVQDVYLAVNGEYTFEQTRILPGQDFTLPPGAYFLLGASAGITIPLDDAHLELSLAIENALNTSYRNYLNRLRYFADELGMNVRMRAHYHF
ncbi:MAG: hypothetical protein R3330_16910, partial [Saprospiraceae bacterium]|nr:hypothetical protein [Saprospiraceae bacterium]